MGFLYSKCFLPVLHVFPYLSPFLKNRERYFVFEKFSEMPVIICRHVILPLIIGNPIFDGQALIKGPLFERLGLSGPLKMGLIKDPF